MMTITLLSDRELSDAVSALPGERVTKEYIEGRILRVEYHVLHDVVTVCSIVLDNGYSVRGESACIDPSNYRKDIGETIAYNNAFDKLWPLFGFLFMEVRYQKS